MQSQIRMVLGYSSETFWVIFDQITYGIIGLLSVKILTFYLVSSEYGKLALANTVMTFITANLYNTLGAGLLRFWPICRERNNLNTFYTVANRLSNYSMYVGFFVIFSVVLLLVLVDKIGWITLFCLAFFTGIFEGMYGLRVTVFRAARKQRLIAILNVTKIFLRVLFAFFLVLLVYSDASWAMSGFLIGTAAIYLITEYKCYQPYLRRFKGEQTTLSSQNNLIREILSFSWPFLIWGIFGWGHLSCDRWSLQAFHGSEIVGGFAVVSQLAIYPFIFGSAILVNLFTPIANQRAGDLSDEQSVKTAFKILVIMTILYLVGASITIGFFSIYHQQLLLLVSNINFVKFSFLLPGLTTAWALIYFGHLLNSFGLLLKRSNIYIFPKLCSSAIAMGCTFYLSYKIGPVGVVWGLVLSGVIYALMCSAIALKLIL